VKGIEDMKREEKKKGGQRERVTRQGAREVIANYAHYLRGCVIAL